MTPIVPDSDPRKSKIFTIMISLSRSNLSPFRQGVCWPLYSIFCKANMDKKSEVLVFCVSLQTKICQLFGNFCSIRFGSQTGNSYQKWMIEHVFSIKQAGAGMDQAQLER